MQLNNYKFNKLCSQTLIQIMEKETLRVWLNRTLWIKMLD